MHALIAEIEARGWSWSVGRTAGCTADGYVHLPHGRERCVSANGRTPESALRRALTLAKIKSNQP